MKYSILLFILTFFISCQSREYNKKFYSYIDSANYFSDRFTCYILCHNDSSHIMLKDEKRCIDSINLYFYKLYPNRQKESEKIKKVTPIKIPQNCDCK